MYCILPVYAMEGISTDMLQYWVYDLDSTCVDYSYRKSSHHQHCLFLLWLYSTSTEDTEGAGRISDTVVLQYWEDVRYYSSTG